MHIRLMSNFRPCFFFLALICLNLGKLTGNYILNTDLDFFTRFHIFGRKSVGVKISFSQAKIAASYANVIDKIM